MAGRYFTWATFWFIVGCLPVPAVGTERSAAAESENGEGSNAQIQAVKKVHEDFYSALNAMFKGDPKPFKEGTSLP